MYHVYWTTFAYNIIAVKTFLTTGAYYIMFWCILFVPRVHIDTTYVILMIKKTKCGRFVSPIRTILFYHSLHCISQQV